jgi:uncharacterized protein (DUF362 family)/ferredoxin
VSRVHLLKCTDYDPQCLADAVEDLWQAVVPADLITPGARVLLKPNVINSMPAERAVCTHPQLIAAVAAKVLALGGQVTIADQPGYALADEAPLAFRDTGILEACAGLDVKIELLAHGGYVEVAPAQPYQLPRVQFSRRVLEADVVINLAKAKTHSQTLFTGAIKNMFGATAPRQRLDVHLLGGFWALSEAIVDCYAPRPPDLHFMDAIVGMEGMGPTQGRPCQIGFLAVSTDGVALDAVVQEALGFRHDEVATTVAAANVHLGVADLKAIDITGEPLRSARHAVTRAPVVKTDLIRPFMPVLRWLVTARPKVDRKLCRGCGACAGICPGGAIEIKDLALIDYEKCVECFCCLEACPFDAIGVRRSTLYGIAGAIKHFLDRRAAPPG